MTDARLRAAERAHALEGTATTRDALDAERRRCGDGPWLPARVYDRAAWESRCRSCGSWHPQFTWRSCRACEDGSLGRWYVMDHAAIRRMFTARWPIKMDLVRP